MKSEYPSSMAESGASIKQGGSRFGKTEVSGGISLQGNFVDLTINPVESRLDFCGHFSHSLLEPVASYIPRLEITREIHEQLFSSDVVHNTTRTLVVWGLGGAGKTQLVLDYVQRFGPNYKATFWIEAGRREWLERDIINLYKTLYHGKSIQKNALTTIEEAVIGVKSWFAAESERCLIVYDAADTIENGQSKDYFDIKHLIPNAKNLDVIITTRSSTAQGMTKLKGVNVGNMTQDQAVELFSKYSRLPQGDEEVEHEVCAIVEELDYLALAITLAGTYVGRSPRLQADIRTYLPEYRQRRGDILRRNPEKLIHQYTTSLLTTWETSYRAIGEECPDAQILMTLLSFFSYDDIYSQLLNSDGSALVTREDAERYTGKIWPSMFVMDSLSNLQKLEECFGVLQRYSFITWRDHTKSYTVHKLVHAWGFDRLEEPEKKQFCALALYLMVYANGLLATTSATEIRLLPHAMANLNIVLRLKEGDDKVVTLLSKLGSCVAKSGPETGQTIATYVLAERQRSLGNKHPQTLRAMGRLGVALKQIFNRTDVLNVMNHVLKRIDSPDPETTEGQKRCIFDGLQHVYAPEARYLDQTVWLIGLMDFDQDSSMAAYVRTLACCLASSGRMDEAMTLLEEKWKRMNHVLGCEHLETMQTADVLIQLLVDSEQFERLLKILETTLEPSDDAQQLERPISKEQFLSLLKIPETTPGPSDNAQQLERTMFLKTLKICLGLCVPKMKEYGLLFRGEVNQDDPIMFTMRQRYEIMYRKCHETLLQNVKLLRECTAKAEQSLGGESVSRAFDFVAEIFGHAGINTVQQVMEIFKLAGLPICSEQFAELMRRAISKRLEDEKAQTQFQAYDNPDDSALAYMIEKLTDMRKQTTGGCQLEVVESLMSKIKAPKKRKLVDDDCCIEPSRQAVKPALTDFLDAVKTLKRRKLESDSENEQPGC